MKKCGYCDFWDSNSQQCRRRSPLLVFTAVNKSGWPFSECSDWCGEYAPKGFGGGACICSLGLSKRSHNALFNAKIETIEHLQGLSEFEIKDLPGMGAACYAEIKRKLKGTGVVS